MWIWLRCCQCPANGKPGGVCFKPETLLAVKACGWGCICTRAVEGAGCQWCLLQSPASLPALLWALGLDPLHPPHLRRHSVANRKSLVSPGWYPDLLFAYTCPHTLRKMHFFPNRFHLKTPWSKILKFFPKLGAWRLTSVLCYCCCGWSSCVESRAPGLLGCGEQSRGCLGWWILRIIKVNS